MTYSVLANREGFNMSVDIKNNPVPSYYIEYNKRLIDYPVVGSRKELSFSKCLIRKQFPH